MKKLTCIVLCLVCLSLTAGRKRERFETPQAGILLQIGFNEGPSAKDWSNLGNDGIISGATWGAANGISGGGFSFNGTSDYIEIPNETTFDISGALTLSVWFYYDSTANGTDRFVLGKSNWSSAGKGYHLAIRTDNKLNFTLYEQTGHYLSAAGDAALTVDNWYHVVGTYNGTPTTAGIKMYLNGVEAAGYTDVTFDYIGLNNLPVRVGRDSGTTGYYFTNSLDEVRIYNYALTLNEVQGLYQQVKANVNP